MLEVRNLCAGYNGVGIAHDISFTVKSGEIFTLIGRNGSGKSTLLKTLCGQLPPVSGEIFIDGCEKSGMSRNAFARIVSAMLTDRPKTDMMTCREVTETGRYPYTGTFGLLAENDKRAVDEAMRLTDTTDLADRYFSEISDGQKQRVMLARAVCREPKLLLLDEPTSFLDIHYKLTFLEMLDKLRRERDIAVVMSMHETELAGSISDRVMLIRDGVCKGVGTPAEMLDKHTLTEHFGLTEELYDKYMNNVNQGQ
ncbi:MAG: ABC transporter ATP-binding protein [Ruminiclostridium sp.]|nr:ABC transporter ATP-binding protein [Ruminiclostridium sp.]